MTCCVDASCVLRLWLPGDGQAEARRQFVSWHRRREQLVAPGLIAYEVTNALHQQRRHGRVTTQVAASLLATFDGLGIVLHDDVELQQAALELADTCNLGATYDAAYLALCRRQTATLWTADRRLHGAANDLGLSAELIV